MTFFYMYKALLLLLVLLLLLIGTVNSFMIVQLSNIRKNLAQSLIKLKVREDLDVIYTKIKEESSNFDQSEGDSKTSNN